MVSELGSLELPLDNNDLLSIILTTLVSWTTEAIDNSFKAVRYWRGAGLLKANNISAETETEITWMGSRNLLSRIVRFTLVFTSCV